MSDAAAKPSARSLPPARPASGSLALSLRPAAAGVSKPRAPAGAAATRGRSKKGPGGGGASTTKAAQTGGGSGEAAAAKKTARKRGPQRKPNDDVNRLGASHGRFPGSKKRLRWSQEQDDGLVRFVEEFGTNWPLIRAAWEKAGLDSVQADEDGAAATGGAPVGVRSVAALRQRYYLLVGRRPGKKAPPRRKTLDRWEVDDDMDLLQFIEEGGEGFGPMGTVESSCASLSRSLNVRPGRAMRTDMSVYNRVRRLAMKEGVSIYEFLGLLESSLTSDAAAAMITNEGETAAQGSALTSPSGEAFASLTAEDDTATEAQAAAAQAAAASAVGAPVVGSGTGEGSEVIMEEG